jgi:hypothetical protein
MPGSLSQIWVLLVFIIPGSVIMRVKRVAYPTAEASTGSTILDSLTLSCVVYALASPSLYLSYRYRWPVTRPVLFAFLALVSLARVKFEMNTIGTDHVTWISFSLFGVLAIDSLDRTLFWPTADLENKLLGFKPILTTIARIAHRWGDDPTTQHFSWSPTSNLIDGNLTAEAFIKDR